MIDTSGSNLSELSKQRNPEWKEMQVFLKVLLVGKVSLFLYNKGSNTKFFYSINQGEIKQLVYKEYYTETKDYIKSNRLYQQQLMRDINCNSAADVAGIKYVKKHLLNYFRKYNLCEGYPYKDFINISQRNYFNFKITVGVNAASLNIYNSLSNKSFSFDRQLGYEFGFEAEAIMPFNRDKFRIVLLPTFQNYNSSIEYKVLSDKKAYLTVDYKSFE